MCRLLLVPILMLAVCGTSPPATPVIVQPPVRDTPVERPESTDGLSLHVDHAWVKDASSAGEQVQRRAALDALRAKVEAGAGFSEAFRSLHADPGPWHVAEGETYPYDVIPAAARDLPVGTLSTVIPGNGGLHLFRILGRERSQ